MKNDFDSLLRSIFPGQTGSGNVSEEEKARIRRRMEALERQTAQSITNTQQEILRQTTQFQEEHRRDHGTEHSGEGHRRETVPQGDPGGPCEAGVPRL